MILLALRDFFNSAEIRRNCKYSFYIVVEGFHHRHSLIHAALIGMAVCFVGKGWIGVAQDVRKSGDVGIFLHPVSGECMSQGMNAASREADFVQDSAKRAVEVVPIRGISDSVGKNVGAGLAGVIGGPCAASFEAFPQMDTALFFQQGAGLLC